MNILKKNTDLIARIKYLTTAEGGRHTPAYSGYRPQVKFDFSEMQTSGQQVFVDKEIVYPGDTVTAEIAIISTEFFAHRLFVGQTFEFREGSRIIGTGEILEIKNKELLKTGTDIL